MSIAVLCFALAQALSIEQPTTSTRCWVGQALELRAGFALPAAALERGLVQVFQQPLDVPVAFDVPWWDGLDWLEPLDPPAAFEGAQHEGGERDRRASASLVLNGAVARFERGARTELDGSTTAWFALERRFITTRAGELVLAPSTLRGTHATRFGDDLVLGSKALDGAPFEQRGPSVVLQVLELPEAGRPPEFRGAIGVLSPRQALSSPEVELGAELRLVIEVEGGGNHGRFALSEPVLPAGLRRMGSLSSNSALHSALEISIRAERAGDYDLPGYALPHFDPVDERYATATSGGLRLRVRSESTSGPTAGARPEARPVLVALLALGICFALVLALLVLRLRAKRRARLG
ncbi:MAG: protein BatD [Planctomycetes bacterium]|nr:protein BatD [Planctomycetota bacterium]